MLIQRVVPALEEAARQGRRVIYIDEATFGSWTLPAKEWAPYRINH